jgi:predicted CXXCH cytochrome family protein
MTFQSKQRGNQLAICLLIFSLGVVLSEGCVPVETPPPDDSTVYNNTTDPTNKGAVYIGSDACRACHPTINEYQRLHGHNHKLTRVQGEPPEFPPEAFRAGVPDPPEGFEWSDISYVIGGYIRKARFIDNDGFILTTGVEGVPTQWNLSFPTNGTAPGFSNYEPEAEAPKPYDFSCFRCHTTGAKPQDEDFPEFQENRPGFIGTWEEAGVQCEACHGPGSNHISRPSARDNFVDLNASACGQCHTRGEDPNVIEAAGGFIKHHEQYPELLSSGAHASFRCITCHDPHRSSNYDLENALRTECTGCHTTQTMAIHDGKIFVRDDYTETLSCVSCHMPYATKSALAASAAVVGPIAKMGDTKTHIFRINTQAVDSSQFFNEDGSAVTKDTQGRAAVTVDFVCLRCHNGIGSAFELTLESAASIARGMHGIGQ